MIDVWCHVFRYTIFKDHVTLEDCILCLPSVHELHIIRMQIYWLLPSGMTYFSVSSAHWSMLTAFISSYSERLLIWSFTTIFPTIGPPLMWCEGPLHKLPTPWLSLFAVRLKVCHKESNSSSCYQKSSIESKTWSVVIFPGWHYCFEFPSVLTLFDEWQEGHLACKKAVPLVSKILYRNKCWKKTSGLLSAKQPLKLEVLMTCICSCVCVCVHACACVRCVTESSDVLLLWLIWLRWDPRRNELGALLPMTGVTELMNDTVHVGKMTSDNRLQPWVALAW